MAFGSSETMDLWVCPMLAQGFDDETYEGVSGSVCDENCIQADGVMPDEGDRAGYPGEQP
jgi:hypothetical protein